MLTDEEIARKARAERRLRWSQFANTLAVTGIAVGFLALAGYFVARSDIWQRQAVRAEAPPPKSVAVKKPTARPPVPVAAPAPVATVAPVAVAAPKPPARPPAQPATQEAKDQKPYRLEAEATTAAQPRTRESAPAPEPRIVDAGPSTQTPAAADALAQAGGPGAKRMLNSIKCFDDFGFDYEAGGRQYFSALCKGGNRKQVSCIGSGCRIEYAPAPSHLPGGG